METNVRGTDTVVKVLLPMRDDWKLIGKLANEVQRTGETYEKFKQELGDTVVNVKQAEFKVQLWPDDTVGIYC